MVSKNMNTDAGAAEICNGIPHCIFVRFARTEENVVKESDLSGIPDLIGVDVSLDIESALKESCRRLNESKEFLFRVEESTPAKVFQTQFMFIVKLKRKPNLLAKLFGFT